MPIMNTRWGRQKQHRALSETTSWDSYPSRSALTADHRRPYVRSLQPGKPGPPCRVLGDPARALIRPAGKYRPADQRLACYKLARRRKPPPSRVRYGQARADEAVRGAGVHEGGDLPWSLGRREEPQQARRELGAVPPPDPELGSEFRERRERPWASPIWHAKPPPSQVDHGVVDPRGCLRRHQVVKGLLRTPRLGDGAGRGELCG